MISIETHRNKQAGKILKARAEAGPSPENSRAFIVFTPYVDASGTPAAQVASSTEGPFNDDNPAHQAMKAVTAKIEAILLGEALARQTLGVSHESLEKMAGEPKSEEPRLILPLALAKERNEKEKDL